MTEQEWDVSDEPCRLLAHLHSLPGDRKLLLYAVACCRAHWDLLTHPASREAVEWAERCDDGKAPRDEQYARLEYKSEGAAFRLEEASRRQSRVEWFDDPPHGAVRLAGRLADAVPSRQAVAAYFANHLLTLDSHSPFDPTLGRYRSLLLLPPLRDIFGNPFRPVAFDPAWRTDTATALARQMYESRDFSAMPILADALQDAGCDDPDVLAHCRQAGEHVRGCWAVDLVLGKA